MSKSFIGLVIKTCALAGFIFSFKILFENPFVAINNFEDLKLKLSVINSTQLLFSINELTFILLIIVIFFFLTFSI